MSNAEERREFTTGLRDLADWYDQHSTVPLPSLARLNAFGSFSPELVRQLAPATKHYGGGIVWLRRAFGPIELDVNFARAAVCTRRVVGTREIPEKIIPGHTEPARVEEIVEWDCGTLLESD